MGIIVYGVEIPKNPNTSCIFVQLYRDADDSCNDLTTNVVIVCKRNLPFVIHVNMYIKSFTVKSSIIFKISNGKITTDI